MTRNMLLSTLMIDVRTAGYGKSIIGVVYMPIGKQYNYDVDFDYILHKFFVVKIITSSVCFTGIIATFVVLRLLCVCSIRCFNCQYCWVTYSSD